MSDQRNQVAPAKKLSPWGVLAVALVGAFAGAGISSAVGASDPWNVVITAAAVAIVLLLAWAVRTLRHLQRSTR